MKIVQVHVCINLLIFIKKGTQPDPFTRSAPLINVVLSICNMPIHGIMCVTPVQYRSITNRIHTSAPERKFEGYVGAWGNVSPHRV